MADDGESLESMLSEFVLKLTFSRSLIKVEACIYVLRNCRCLKRSTDSRDIAETEKYCANSSVLSESVFRQLLATDGWC